MGVLLRGCHGNIQKLHPRPIQGQEHGIDARVMWTDGVRIHSRRNRKFPCEIKILLHVSPQILLTNSMGLVVIEDVPKPPEVVFMLHQTRAAVILRWEAPVVEIPTEAKVKGQSRHIASQGGLGLDQRLENKQLQSFKLD